MQPPKMANSPPPRISSAATAPAQANDAHVGGMMFAGIAVAAVILIALALLYRLIRRPN